jgi:hypothetical protein
MSLMDEIILTKKCSGPCGLLLPLVSFRKRRRADANSPEGRNNCCKKCTDEANAQSPTTKLCDECWTVMDLACFSSALSGLKDRKSHCKACTKKWNVTYTPPPYQRPAVTVPTVTKKFCKSCGKTKPASEWPRKARSSDGLSHECKTCDSKTQTARRAARTPEQVARDSQYHRDRRTADPLWARKRQARRHNLPDGWYEATLAAQDGKCGNQRCGRTDPEGRTPGLWYVDHDHTCCPSGAKSCGRCLRGLLCAPCNLALGLLRDDEEVALGLVEYRHQGGTSALLSDHRWTVNRGTPSTP